MPLKHGFIVLSVTASALIHSVNALKNDYKYVASIVSQWCKFGAVMVLQKRLSSVINRVAEKAMPWASMGVEISLTHSVIMVMGKGVIMWTNVAKSSPLK